jgi:hypothetical protein
MPGGVHERCGAFEHRVVALAQDLGLNQERGAIERWDVPNRKDENREYHDKRTDGARGNENASRAFARERWHDESSSGTD